MHEEASVSTLVRLGLQDLASARPALAGLPQGWSWVLEPLSRCSDPDLALSGLFNLATRCPELAEPIAENETLGVQLVAVLANSLAFQHHLLAHPSDLDVLAEPAELASPELLRNTMLTLVGADPDAALPVSGETVELSVPAAADRLRLGYRRELLRITAYDLTAERPSDVLPLVANNLAELADATLEAALAIARAEVGPDAKLCRLAVIGLGKCGARELNYVSDVDVLFVAEPALDEAGEPLAPANRIISIGTRLASVLSRICSANTASGTVWQVDAALRPEGKAGALVRSLAGMEGYYTKWAKAWEFQAMMKARTVAGDRKIGAEFIKLIEPLVWKVGEEEGFVGDTQAMRQRVISLIPAKEKDREIKLGEGGLRDVEFSVQLLQLVHGRVDERLRTGSTFTGLEALIEAGYIGRTDGADFGEAYRLQRVLEHRVQLFRLRRTHLLPTDEPQLRRIARSVGFSDADSLTRAWRSASRQVLTLHRRLFYSRLLEAVAKIPSEHIQFSNDAARDWLRALGYRDPKAALRHLEALTQGITRQAEIQRQLLPAMLGWFAQAPNPDHGLLAFRQVSETLGSTSWYLRALRDEGAMAERLAVLLATSRYLVDLLRRSPQTMKLLAEPGNLAPLSRVALVERMSASVQRHQKPEDAIEAVRAVRRHELFRIGAGDVLGLLDVEGVGTGLSDVASATVELALRIAMREVGFDAPMAVVAMGRWGGGEMSYSSDADALFIVCDEATPEEQQLASKAVTLLRKLLSAPGPDPALPIDADLRPEGKGGPMVRTLSSYQSYYRRWSSTWESQALIRASHGAGDEELSGRLLSTIDRLRYPEEGLQRAQLQEIRKMKARMEAERLPRGADPKRHLKLGPGGLSDVEWTVQLLQLQHGWRYPALQTTGTLRALSVLETEELVSAEEARALRQSWMLASRLRNQIMLVRGRASDIVPLDDQDGSALAHLMGHGRRGTSHLVADYRRVARRARSVVDGLFWGLG